MQDRRAVVRELAAGLLVAAAACGPPHPARVDPSAQFDPRRQVKVWHGGDHSTVHAARAHGDSLSGVPYRQPVECDSCRIEFALSDIDSLREIHGERNAVLGTALPIVVLGAALAAWRLSEGD